MATVSGLVDQESGLVDQESGLVESGQKKTAPFLGRLSSWL
jgi:hypothetical protein